MAIKALMIDVDGVLWEWEKPIPGVDKAIDYLNSNGYKYYLVSSVTRFSKKSFLERLRKIGLDIKEGNMMPVRTMAIDYIKSKNPGAKCFVIGPDDMEEEFQEEGIQVTRKEEPIDFVVIGYDSDFNYQKMCTVLRMLMDGAELLGLHKGKFYEKNGKVMVNMGTYIAGLEYASNKKAVIMGKPMKSFFELILGKLGTTPGETLMVGDNVFDDIEGAQKLGIQTALVKTGVYRTDIVEKSGVTPDFLINSFANIPEILEKNK